jgi:hypothetical protein
MFDWRECGRVSSCATATACNKSARSATPRIPFGSHSGDACLEEYAYEDARRVELSGGVDEVRRSACPSGVIAQLPESEIYHFKPLDEHVPVYQKPFTLVQELILERDPKNAQRCLERKSSSGVADYSQAAQGTRIDSGTMTSPQCRRSVASLPSTRGK